MNQPNSNHRTCKFLFGDGKKFQSHFDQSESSRGIIGGGKKYKWDICQLESNKSAEKNISPYDIEPEEGVVSKTDQSDSSIHNNLKSGKTSLFPNLTQHKAALIPLILEKIPVKLIINKSFQMSKSEFNLPLKSH